MPDAVRNAVVIGGGIGIGEANCRLMSERGWRVVVADREQPAAERVAAAVGGHAFVMEFAIADEVERAASAIAAAHGPVSALVVAAAMFQDVLPPAQLPMEVWERTLQVNLGAVRRRARGTHALIVSRTRPQAACASP